MRRQSRRLLLASLRTVAARAEFLSERLREADRGVSLNPQIDIGQTRLERWRQSVGPSSSDWLERRLDWDGLTLHDAAALLADAASSPNDPVPNWIIALEDISLAARDFDPAQFDHSPLDPRRPVPFQDLLLPALAVARDRLRVRLRLDGTAWSFPLLGVVSARAYQALERGLLQQISSIAGQTLDSEFHDFLPYGVALLARFDIKDDDKPGDEHYRRFVQQHLRDGLLGLFDGYPVLGRLLATATILWVETTAEFMERATSDRSDLAACFQLPTAPFEIADIEVALSDPHRGNRSVMALELCGGRRLVYKPKPLGLEAAFNSLLDWCNQRTAFDDLKVTVVLDRGAYGWVEFVEQMPCTDEPAARRFYVRAGMLLCLLRAIRATDCHYENLIAHGEHLVLIDTETLMSHDAQPLDDSSWSEADEPLAERHFRESVLRTGLLPRWQFAGDAGVAYDVSGLGSVVDSPPIRRVQRWERINTDDMHMRDALAPAPARKNVAWREGEALSPLNYQPELIRGFEQMYRFVLDERAALSATDGPLAAMRAYPVRFIYRATRVYGSVQSLSTSPQLLRSGIDYGIHLEQLARAFLVASRKPHAWPVFAAEVAAMEQMDIPLFLARADETALDLGGGATLSQALRRSSFDDTVASLAAMSEIDLQQQCAIIEGSFQAKAAHTADGAAVDARVANVAAPHNLDRDGFLRAATAIGVELERRALIDGEGNASWIGLGYIDHADRFQLQMLDDNLYDGAPGVALFLAALAKTTGESRFGRLALRGIEPTRRRLRALDPASRSLVARLRGIGGAVGLGSTIYAFVQTAALLNDAQLLDDAVALAEWLTADVVGQDTKLDVMSGAAGALLGLLSLYAKRPSAQLLAAAEACGDHLLARRTPSGTAPRAWLTTGDRPLTGFSHGAAGIAYSLIRLYGVTRRTDYLDAALEAIAFERSVFSEAHGNWPDLRELGAPKAGGFPVKWCHGAAGIALARLGGRNLVDVAGADRDIAIALATTKDHYLQDTDYLCCGNFGRVETFLVAASMSAEPSWRMLAETGASASVQRATAVGHYRLFVDVPGMYNPGFFQGMAGIGYQLLRLADERLPSVLIWE